MPFKLTQRVSFVSLCFNFPALFSMLPIYFRNSRYNIKQVFDKQITIFLVELVWAVMSEFSMCTFPCEKNHETGLHRLKLEILGKPRRRRPKGLGVYQTNQAWQTGAECLTKHFHLKLISIITDTWIDLSLIFKLSSFRVKGYCSLGWDPSLLSMFDSHHYINTFSSFSTFKWILLIWINY